MNLAGRLTCLPARRRSESRRQKTLTRLRGRITHGRRESADNRIGPGIDRRPALDGGPRSDRHFAGPGELQRRSIADRSRIDGLDTRSCAKRFAALGRFALGLSFWPRPASSMGGRPPRIGNWLIRLAQRYPRISVDGDRIFTQDGNVWTSAGVSAGIDLALAMVEEDHGHALALEIARRMVLFMRRGGGQSQFSSQLAAQAADHQPIRELVAWISEHLDADLSVPALARRVGMSERNFSRVFTQQVNTTPARFVARLRRKPPKPSSPPRLRSWKLSRRVQDSAIAKHCGVISGMTW